MLGHLLRVAHSHLREAVKRATRSPEWSAVERAFRARHPTCAACGGTAHLQVHHVDPFHLFPARELILSNLITLCMGPEECHLRIGHGGNWTAYNPRVREDAATLLEERARIASLVARIKERRLTA